MFGIILCFSPKIRGNYSCRAMMNYCTFQAHEPLVSNDSFKVNSQNSWHFSSCSLDSLSTMSLDSQQINFSIWDSMTWNFIECNLFAVFDICLMIMAATWDSQPKQSIQNGLRFGSTSFIVPKLKFASNQFRSQSSGNKANNEKYFAMTSELIRIYRSHEEIGSWSSLDRWYLANPKRKQPINVSEWKGSFRIMIATNMNKFLRVNGKKR